MAGLSNLGSLASAKKRKAFFSFHYDDVMRVNVVRNAFKIYNPTTALYPSFYDSSLWESRKLQGDDALKRLIREGVDYTSVVCVLVGSQTCVRRWCRYEIARAVIDGRGLLAVHINSIRPVLARGPNPLAYMGVGKVQNGLLAIPQYYLFEGNEQSQWVRYKDYTNPISLPPYLHDMPPGFVRPLSSGTGEYDFMGQNGHQNIGGWIDMAAQEVGR
jgi:hypothetical protein